MLPAAAAAQPLALDQARLYIQRLLSIINERNAQLELLKTHLDQKTELCKLHEARADRAEANATAAREQLLLQPQHAPGLSPADLAALNTLPPAERDATWLRRVFETRAPLGPYELAGLYLDAFAWTRTAATGSDIVGAVARVFPGVQLVHTGCGLRFRGVVRAQVQVAVTQETPARQIRTERNAAPPDASSRPVSASPRPAAAHTAKRKRSPEPEPEASTSKRVRTAQGGAVKGEGALDLRMLHDVGTSPVQVRAQVPAVETPPRVRHSLSRGTPAYDLQSTVSVGTQTINVCKTYADVDVEARNTRPAQQPHPTVSIGMQTIDVCKTYAESGVQVCDTRPALQPGTCAEAEVQACDTRPQFAERPPDRDALLADLATLPPVPIPPDLPPLRVPPAIIKSALPDRAVRIVSSLRRGEHGRDGDASEQETFRDYGGGSGGLEYLGTYVFRPVCVGYSRAVHEALARAVLDAEVRVLSQLGVGDSDSESDDENPGGD